MKTNMKKAWLALEKELGQCLLHKRAAFNEASGNKIGQLTLATAASPDTIKKVLETKQYEMKDGRFVFTYEDVKVELSSFHGITENEKLCEAMFLHALRIDSIGYTSSGLICDRYGGLDDIDNKTVSLTRPDAVITEYLYGRILQLIAKDGYMVEKSLMQRLISEDLVVKPGYRRKYCEAFKIALLQPQICWDVVGMLLSVAKKIFPEKSLILQSTLDMKNASPDEKWRREYMWVIFSRIGATGKELARLFPEEPLIENYDSICMNLQVKLSDYEEYKRLQKNYGKEFIGLLMDIQSMWMTLEGIEYKRVSETDFDPIQQFIADEQYWFDPQKGRPQVTNQTNSDISKKNEYVVTPEKIDAGKLLGIEFDPAEYEEGIIEDTFYQENTEGNTDSDVEEESVQKKDICIDDDLPEDEEIEGLDIEALESYENGALPPAPVISEKNEVHSVVNKERGHKSRVLTDGGK